MRLGLFIILILIGLYAPAWIFFPLAVAYAYWVRAYELIFLGMCIDAQFGANSVSFGYTYTLLLGTVVLIAESTKPYLVFYRI